MTTQPHSMEQAHGGGAVGTRQEPWRTWPDWINVVIGAYVILAPIWTAGVSTGWFVVLGILAVAAGLWALGTASSAASEWVQVVIGVVVFLSPWFGSYAGMTGGAWTAWIAGLALVVFAFVGMSMAKKSA